jgi:hypothetical protein
MASPTFNNQERVQKLQHRLLHLHQNLNANNRHHRQKVEQLIQALTSKFQ